MTQQRLSHVICFHNGCFPLSKWTRARDLWRALHRRMLTRSLPDLFRLLNGPKVFTSIKPKSIDLPVTDYLRPIWTSSLSLKSIVFWSNNGEGLHRLNWVVMKLWIMKCGDTKGWDWGPFQGSVSGNDSKAENEIFSWSRFKSGTVRNRVVKSATGFRVFGETTYSRPQKFHL